MPPTKGIYRLAALACAGVLLLGLACRPLDEPDEIQALAGEMPSERPAATGGGDTAAPSESLDAFPLVGSVFPGMGGRLHSSLCDPTADADSTCI